MFLEGGSTINIDSSATSDRSRTLNISDSKINSSGAAGFGLGDLSGTAANTINQPPSSSNTD